MKTICFKLFILLAVFAPFVLGAQTRVEIYPDVQRYLGEVSDLDRSKYFKIHSTASDAMVQSFRNNFV